MRAYKALDCDSGEVGPPMKKLQPAREMSLEARATPVSQYVEVLLGQKPQRPGVRLMDGEASGVGDRPRRSSGFCISGRWRKGCFEWDMRVNSENSFANATENVLVCQPSWTTRYLKTIYL